MQNNINKISVFGDSILKGAVTGTNSGHLFDIIEENSLAIACKNLNLELNNQSVFGNIISKAQRKFNKELERQNIGDLTIIESGGNDCDYDWNVVCQSPNEFHEPRTPLNDFIRIIDEMVQSCRKNKITPLLMTMPPLVSDYWNNHICTSYDKQAVLTFTKNNPNFLYQNHELYNLNLLKYCYQNNVQFVDMRTKLLENPDLRKLWCLDGIHPNAEGYKFMATIWQDELPKVKKEF